MQKKSFVVFVLLALLSLLISCDMSMDSSVLSRSMSASTAETSRKVEKSGAPASFTATVNVYQQLGSVVTEHKGNSNHYKTVEETLQSFAYGPYGGTITSDWPLLDGKNVIMNNVTNYNLDPASGAISGSNHSVIQVVDDAMQVVAVLQANGTIDGSLLGAQIAMNWTLKEVMGKKVNARGKVGGLFTWAVFNYETMSLEYILPNGTFTLTGTYN
ncbi:MAG: hypothetical protein GX626_07300 [Spirochaetales bacterium]|nr:hypothetical protein [Spirochaetales bacterium]